MSPYRRCNETTEVMDAGNARFHGANLSNAYSCRSGRFILSAGLLLPLQITLDVSGLLLQGERGGGGATGHILVTATL